MAVAKLALNAFWAALCLVDAFAFLPPASHLSPPALGPLPFPRAESHCRLMAASGTGDGTLGPSVGKPIEINMTEGEDDLYVVGAGYLGKMVARLWLEKFPTATVVCETRSVVRHVGDMPEGSTFVLRKHRLDYQRKYRNVVFTASPKGNQDYEHELFQAAAHLWDGLGMLVMTSTGSIYAESEGGMVTEYSPVDNTKMTSRIIEGAENFAIGAGGCVIRLAGLYSVDRGPHNVWLTMKKVMQHPQGVINLLSYEDAADIVVSALLKGRPEPNPLDNPSGGQKIKGYIFLACDDQPTTRQDICEIALKHPFHGWKKMPEFEVTGQCRGQSGAKRMYDSSRTREVLDWQPKWKSFMEYFEHRIAEVREMKRDEAAAAAAAAVRGD